jgi:PAS domain S-box-containing protein
MSINPAGQPPTGPHPSEGDVTRQLAAIVEGAGDAIVGQKLDGTITSWNRAAEKMFGYAAGEAIGQSIRLIIPTDRSREEDDALARLRRGKIIHDFETVGVRKDGTRIQVSLTISPVRDSRGDMVGASRIARDISERKRGEEEERRIRDQFRLAVEAAPAAMIMVDQRGTVVMVNALTERLLGYTREELLGQSIEKLVPPRFRNRHVADRKGFFVDLRQRPMGAGRELFAVRRDGSEVPVEIGLSPVQLEGSTFVLAAVTDIAERKALEQERAALLAREQAARGEMERASRLKDEFLAVLSHELRTPLNAVLGYSNLLNAGLLPPERTVHALEAIQRNARAQARLVESLLDLSRIMAGKLELDLEAVWLLPIIAAAMDVVRPEAESKGITMTVAQSRDDAVVVGDAGRLQQVFWNLLSNAVKFTPRGGRVDVTVATRDREAHIEVHDTGQGIKQEFLPYVFERFSQAEGQPRRSPTGLGLGLALVREMVQAHRGSVTVASSGEGGGSTFTVVLPLSSSSETPREPEGGRAVEGATHADLRGAEVLVVDDEKDVRDLLRIVLESRGATVLTASSAAEALHIIRKHRPDVLLADLRMPEEDGYALIYQLRMREREAKEAPLPAVAVTAYATAADRERAIAAGFDWHVTKPVDPGDLARAILKVRSGRSVT